MNVCAGCFVPEQHWTDASCSLAQTPASMILATLRSPRLTWLRWRNRHIFTIQLLTCIKHTNRSSLKRALRLSNGLKACSWRCLPVVGVTCPQSEIACALYHYYKSGAYIHQPSVQQVNMTGRFGRMFPVQLGMTNLHSCNDHHSNNVSQTLRQRAFALLSHTLCLVQYTL